MRFPLVEAYIGDEFIIDWRHQIPIELVLKKTDVSMNLNER